MNGNFILGHAAFFPHRIPVGDAAPRIKRRRLVRPKRKVKTASARSRGR